jgi:two-component system, OmpR family, sensor histidine kinase BaeS
VTMTTRETTGLPPAARGGRSRLAVRLALAFLVVALGALAVLTVVTLLSARGGFSELAEQRQQATLDRVAVLVAQAYEDAGGWSGADLHPAAAVAAADGAQLAVRDVDGRRLPRGPMRDMGGMMQRMHGRAPEALGPPVEQPVLVGGEAIGTVEVHFPLEEGARAELELRDALTRNVLLAAGLAAVLALGAATVVAGRLTRPLTRLTGTVEAVAAGDRSARSGAHAAPGELGVLGGAVDRMADTLERQEQLRRALVADVAHELRTPLAIALGECDAILDGIVDLDAERLRSVREEIVRLSRLVEDLEAMAAAESATLHLELEPLDLADVVEDLLTVHAPRLRERGLEVHERLEPAAVEGDRVRLGQIVTNLLTNAGKFSPAGGRVDIEVATEGAFAVCAVTDDGPGVPPDELPHVFERFWQGSAAAGAGGSGVGLAVAAELARAHGGGVEVVNAPGRGARFTVRLPAA